MTLFKYISDHYFRPKSFESYKNGRVYEIIGIRLFKKYLPTSGDLIRHRRKIRMLEINKSGRNEQLKSLLKTTRNYEVRHIAGIILFLMLVYITDKKLSLFDILFLFLLNLYVNIYPVFLQRYNRIRLLKVLKDNKGNI